MKKGITIFTPTYNRINTLPRLYQSLLKQNIKNFEWLIVDDGSTDNSVELINKWKKEKNIEINYIYQENHGKSYAYNVGVKNAKYEWFICLDSDDYLVDNALIIVKKIINSYNNNHFVGLVSLRLNINNDNICLKKPIDTGKLVSFADLYRKYKCNGDTAIIYKTDILKNNLFPCVENEKFIPEQYIHDKMDLEGKLLYFNEKIYCGEYLKDGYTNNTANLLKKNPKGYLIAGDQRLKYSSYFRNKIMGSIQVNIAHFILNKKFYILSKKYSIIDKLLLLLTLLPSYIYYKKNY